MPQLSKPGNSVYVEIGVWWNPEQGNIHLTAKGVDGFHTTVNGNGNSKRGHPNLFLKLAKLLRDAGAPHPAIDDSENA